MHDQSLRTYLREYRSSIVLAGLAGIFFASLLWHFYPTFYSCCDAESYWTKSNSFNEIRKSGVYFRTFAYPTLIAISRALPKLLGSGDAAERMVLSLVQLGLHFIASISLGYVAYALIQNKVVTNCAIYINTLNIFLLAYTNQILTDGVAISALTIAIAAIVFCLAQITKRTLPMLFAGLAVGILPMIRPSLVVASIILSGLFLSIYLYQNKFKLSTFLNVGIYIFCFLIPLFVQLLLVPTALLDSGGLGDFQIIHGAYMSKYMTVLKPVSHGYAAITQSMKTLVDVCESSPTRTNCIKAILFAHPIAALGHYFTKLLAVNDQVYLTPYISNFYAPERQIWRLLSSLLSAMSILGALALIKRGIKGEKTYFLYMAMAGLMIAILILPLVVGAPEERFGLTLHPFLAFFTSYFICDIFAYQQWTKLRILSLVFIITFVLFSFSLRIESLFCFRTNYLPENEGIMRQLSSCSTQLLK
jgi:hypothetical protein